ncbi:MAG: hypothetical protein M3O46_09615 [Myxococcota bacterium]|nr:hypothetical protein [Myxococcota bacterium]
MNAMVPERPGKKGSRFARGAVGSLPARALDGDLHAVAAGAGNVAGRGGSGVLRTDGGDMRSGHVVPNIDEEARVVFAVGETDKRLQGEEAARALGMHSSASRSGRRGLDKANFVDWD